MNPATVLIPDDYLDSDSSPLTPPPAILDSARAISPPRPPPIDHLKPSPAPHSSFSSAAHLSVPASSPPSRGFPTTRASSFLRPGAVFVGRQSFVPSPFVGDSFDAPRQRTERYRNATASLRRSAATSVAPASVSSPSFHPPPSSATDMSPPLFPPQSSSSDMPYHVSAVFDRPARPSPSRSSPSNVSARRIFLQDSLPSPDYHHPSSSHTFHGILQLAREQQIERRRAQSQREQHQQQEQEQQQSQPQPQSASHPQSQLAPQSGPCRCREEWQVRVIIHSVDIAHGTVKGSMQAINVPNSSKHVITSFEGEIIDFVNHDLWTRRSTGYSAADRGVDLEYWSLVPAFAGLHDHEIVNTKLQSWEQRSASSDWILMRWKERDFVNCQPHESGLTIQGYYYCCLSRKDGRIEAYYHDVSSAPYQKLSLAPIRSASSRVSFTSFDVL